MSRSYESPVRAAEAAATRANVVRAAATLFVRQGYAATSIKAIAAEAGVSVPTVHAHGPKHALLIAAFEVAFAGDEGRHSLAERPQVAAIMAEPDFHEAVRAYVDFLYDANRRAASISRALRSAADADPAARVAYADLELRRHRDMTIAAGWFLQRGRIRVDQLAAAADVLGHLTGPDPYLHLVDARGWGAEEYTSWLTVQLERLSESLAEPGAPT